MKIAIIGTGSVGSALALGLSRTQHEILLGTRAPDEQRVQEFTSQSGAKALVPSAAAAQADIVILALPWAAVEPVARALGALAGKIVIDCTNPLGMVDGVLNLVVGHTTSGGEIVQNLFPDARVVKTLNQVGAEIMADNGHMALRPVMFTAGQDDAAKTVVGEMLIELGFDAHDAGGIEKSRLLEPLAMAWINQSIFQGKGRAWAFAAAT